MKNLFITLLFLVLGAGFSYAAQDTGPPTEKFQIINLEHGYNLAILSTFNFKAEAEVHRWEFKPILNISDLQNTRNIIQLGAKTAGQTPRIHRAPRDGLRCNRETID